ncbi:MAG: NAD(P)/FAD-dependent oxidoreductase [Proteobacteria bacterium]|nr:NAD(P)/FAD-dependent oxidoreductase [Pseudomonadota bacterium]MDA0993046.1 NAD(P)/FAD-dependent oxidoreductase [Pseudomonadota bacterium]
MKKPDIVIIGAGINGLVAANYLQRAGCNVTMIDRAERVGGACVSATATVDGQTQPYALGASVLGLMQDFVFDETGLSSRLQTFVPEHPKFIFFPGDKEPTWIFRDPVELDRELARKWGEKGDVEAFREDEAKVVSFLQEGYVNATPPSLDEAKEVLGDTLTKLWISGSARTLMDHYLTSERSKMYMAMTVTESGPVPLSDPYSAFTLPLMDSGSIFGGYYGFVKGGIWQITEELGRLNAELGVKAHLSSKVVAVDAANGSVSYKQGGTERKLKFDYVVMGTDPLTAIRLVGSPEQIAKTEGQRFLGSSGKLNLMFRKPVRWKYGSDAADSDAAFRFLFSVSSVDEYEDATLKVLDAGVDYVPGYMQIYCEGAAMRQLKHDEPFDRLAVFFKNLSLGEKGADLANVESMVREKLLEHIQNPEDCAWTRLLTPRDLQQLFYFPGGNLDHTMLTGGQTFFDRTYADDPATDFYRMGGLNNVFLCGSGTYPCGSVAGTPGYMCSQQLLRQAELMPQT